MILITGASAGIGAATARLAAKKRHSLILWARRADRLEKLRDECLALGSPEVAIVPIDVSSRKDVAEEFEVRRSLYQRATALVNNAGLARGLDTFPAAALDDFEEMIDTNVKGFLYVLKGILPFFIEKKDGHVVSLGSVAGRWSYPKGHVYSSTKAFVKMVSESLRLDVLGTGVRVTEIAPGMVETEFSETRFSGDKAKAKAVYAGLTPLSAEDVAESILWSLDRPKHVNIQEIVIYPTDQASPTQAYRRG